MKKNTMKKSAMIVGVMATMVCSGVSAAPLTDYSVGKTAIDLNLRSSEINLSGGGVTPDYDAKNNLDWGITTALGNKVAVQYNGYNAKSKDTTFTTSIENAEVKAQEFNVLYQINKNISVYTGLIKTKGFVDIVSSSTTYSTDDKSKMQFGLIGNKKIGDKMTAYASFGVASDITNWKIGISQEIAPNIEFNLDYRDMKVNNVTFAGVSNSFDVTSKGLGCGITYKF